MNKEKVYKRKYKPSICTQSPIKYLIPYKLRYDILRQIRVESKNIYDTDCSSECEKRLVCIGKKCMGRRIPWDSPTALKYLNILRQRGLVNEDGDLEVIACTNCPINKICSRPCYMITDFVNRHTKKEPPIAYKYSIENFEQPFECPETVKTQQDILNVPWDCLKDNQAIIVRKYLYEQKDFLQIANELNKSTAAQIKYAFYLALNQLSEFAIMRQFLKNNKDKLSKKQRTLLNLVYYKNKSLTYISTKFKISKQSVSARIKRIMVQNAIKPKKFVKKVKGKTIYSIPRLFK